MNNVEFFKRSNGINIDITFRCPLECPRCQRQKFKDVGKKVWGYDISLDEIRKLANYFKSFSFCGQLSDPIHHPQFIEILKLLYEKNIHVNIHNASSFKSMSWYVKAFQAHPNAKWIFGIDGLPEESCLYRKNQDGEKLFKVMVESKKYLNKPPCWQFIIFSYNEHNIEKARTMALKHQVQFMLVQSSRWLDENDPLIPKSSLFKLNYKKWDSIQHGADHWKTDEPYQDAADKKY
jgi:MoaA/NifB/PqqE/SkfB family radical SAM enzyme